MISTKKTILSLTIIIILIVGFTLPSFADLGAFEPSFTVNQTDLGDNIYHVVATLNSKNGCVWSFTNRLGHFDTSEELIGQTVTTTYPYDTLAVQPFPAISTSALNQAVDGSLLEFSIVISNGIWGNLGFSSPSATFGNFIFYNKGDSSTVVKSVESLMDVYWTVGNDFITGECSINLNAFTALSDDYDYWSLEAVFEWASHFVGNFTFTLQDFRLSFDYDSTIVTPDYIQNIDGTLTEIKDEFILDDNRQDILENLQQGAQNEISKAEDIDNAINDVLGKVDTDFNPITVVGNALNNSDKVYFENTADDFGDVAGIFLLVGVSVGFMKFLVFGKG